MKEAFRTFSDLQLAVRQFVIERDWLEFHNPKDLVIAIAVECAELASPFVWKNDLKAMQFCRKKTSKRVLGDELADVVILCCSLANFLGIDLGEVTSKKITKNYGKYPIKKSKTFARKWH